MCIGDLRTASRHTCVNTTDEINVEQTPEPQRGADTVFLLWIAPPAAVRAVVERPASHPRPT
jgi:hypothetical protein